MATIQDWYAQKIGYVLQLAVPYYEELTVRQNLTFAAFMRLPKNTSRLERFERVEQVIAEVGSRQSCFTCFTPKSDQLQIYRAASPEI